MAGVQMVRAGLTADEAREIQQSESLKDDIEEVILPDDDLSLIDVELNGRVNELDDDAIQRNKALYEDAFIGLRSKFTDWSKKRLLELRDQGC